MRAASALAHAAITGFVIASVACTYDIPDVSSNIADGSDLRDARSDGTTNDASMESTVPEAGGDTGGDVGSDVGWTDAGCRGSLCPCTTSLNCTTPICAGPAMVGSDVIGKANGSSFCTKPCCVSEDCDPGTVCYASGTGGSYCVSPGWLGRDPPGGSPGGSSCTSNSQCRSGYCNANACADTCCSLFSSPGCAGGMACNFSTFPGAVSWDKHFAANCEPPISGTGVGGTCSSSPQCQGGLCYPATTGTPFCTAPCRTASECGSGLACQTDLQGSDLYAACFFQPTAKAAGGPCGSFMDCEGGWCNGTTCTNICFTDMDCTVPGWHCVALPYTYPGNGASYTATGCSP